MKISLLLLSMAKQCNMYFEFLNVFCCGVFLAVEMHESSKKRKNCLFPWFTGKIIWHWH